MNRALYYPIDPIHDSAKTQVGQKVYEEFTTVVNLKEQMRITDPVWPDSLQHLQYGQVQEHHLKMLQTLVVGNSIEHKVDFGSAS